MTDQFNPRCMGCAGDPVIKTPHLDRLAREGALFENCYTNSPPLLPSQLVSTSAVMVNDWQSFVPTARFF